MTLKDIYDSMTEEQKSVVCFMVSEAVHNVEVKKNREIGVLKRKINKLEYEKGQIDKLEKQNTGCWILDETDNSITCNKCGCLIWANDISNGEAHYCPNCGAKMKG